MPRIIHPHLIRRLAAFALGAQFRPAGSVNLERLKASRAIPDQFAAQRDQRLRAWFADKPMMTLAEYARSVQRGGKLATEHSIGQVVLVTVNGVHPDPGKGQGKGDIVYWVDTEHGEMLLKEGTFIVLN